MIARTIKSPQTASYLRSFLKQNSISTTRSIFTTAPTQQAMKPGTVIAGLDFMKNVDKVESKERSEYPDWLNNLTEADTTLGKLRKMDIWAEGADEEDQKRYLKLTRRLLIKGHNTDAGIR